MLNDLMTVGGSVLTLLLMIVVGFILGKMKVLGGQTLTQMSNVLLCVVAPALMIGTFQGEARDVDAVRGLLVSAAVLLAVYVLQGLLMTVFFRRAPEESRGVSRFASIYGNVGFMGVPLIMSVLGAPGMAATVISLAIFNIGIWTHGAWLIGGKSQMSLKKVFLNPGVVGIVIALILYGFGINLPGPVSSAVDYIGSLNTPLAMVIIGAQMSAVDIPSLFRDTRLYGVTAIKLLLIPAAVMLVLLPFNIDPVIYIAVVILAGCPVAGATSLMCQIAGRDTSYGAKLVTFSTILSVITLPLVAAAAKFMAVL